MYFVHVSGTGLIDCQLLVSSTVLSVCHETIRPGFPLIQSSQLSHLKDRSTLLSRIRYRDLAVHACSVAQSCLTFCEPVDCSLPGSTVHGISEANPMSTGMGCHILFQEIFPMPEIEPMSPVSPALAGGFFITVLLGKPIEV